MKPSIEFEITDIDALAKQYPHFVRMVPTADRAKIRGALKLGIPLDGVKVVAVNTAPAPQGGPTPLIESPLEPDASDAEALPAFLSKKA